MSARLEQLGCHEHGISLNLIYRVFKKNGAVLKINKKFISHLTRAKRTPSAAETVQVFMH
jgi:hypothetical protein